MRPQLRAVADVDQLDAHDGAIVLAMHVARDDSADIELFARAQGRNALVLKDRAARHHAQVSHRCQLVDEQLGEPVAHMLDVAAERQDGDRVDLVRRAAAAPHHDRDGDDRGGNENRGHDVTIGA